MTSGRGLIPTTEEVLQNAGAFGAHLGFGSIAGYAAGKAMRAGTNIGLVLAGAGFITAQMLQQRGYIQVDWNKVENEVRAVLDVDGDGELTTTDASIAWDGIVDSLRVGVPGSAGFAAGALAGFGGGGVAKLVAVSASEPRRRSPPPRRTLNPTSSANTSRRSIHSSPRRSRGRSVNAWMPCATATPPFVWRCGCDAT
jgi:uncharacterized membrane protein (Fun14 family)